MGNNCQYILECKGITKSFGKNQVLKKVNLSVKPGEVHALLGANGAGKSTLVKIITGVYSHDGGEIILDGEKVDFSGPRDSEKQGIAIIHQDPALVPSFDVTRNAFLCSELIGKFGLLDFGRMRKAVSEKLKLLDADFGPDVLIKELSLGQREQVAIAAALLKAPKLLILDEPTASLSDKEIGHLFEIIKTLKSQGVTVIYISHHLDEVFQISDSITILRDGVNAATLATDGVSKTEIIQYMTGRDIGRLYPKENVELGDELFSAKDLRFSRGGPGVSFSVRKGEIVGFAGLVGAGRTETMLSLYGAEPRYGGEVCIEGTKRSYKSPYGARRCGIAYIPEDRRREGLVGNMSISENISLANMSRWSVFGLINRRKERAITREKGEALSMVYSSPGQCVSELSGGNQQKVVIARWLTGNSKLFILDQPTTGVDVSAKVEIYRQMVSLAKQGAGILFISSEFEELMGMCDRILVMSKGQICKEFLRGEATEKDLLYYATGADS